jgi:6,7-dimethyl-8-ribityllumazine synthase
MKEIQGRLDAQGLRLGIVISRYNEFITKNLLDGAIDCWLRHGGDRDNITVAWVPGAFEVPSVAKRLVGTGDFDTILCLAAVIRGSTPHFDYIAAETTKGVAHVGMEAQCPVVFGVLTTDTIEQAIERAGTKSGNKGWQAALSGIEMAQLYRNL